MVDCGMLRNLRWLFVKRFSLIAAALILYPTPALLAQNDAALAATLQKSIGPFHGKVSLWAVDKATG